MRRLLAIAFAALPATALAAAQIVIVNANAPGVGFNDPTPVAPVGGNTGTTLGEQRLIAFKFAAGIWGATLDSKVEIRIQASFVPLACTATSAVLGSAGTNTVSLNFPGAPFPETWYPAALANKLAGEDLAPPDPTADPPFAGDDIRARFNVNLGNPGCLAGSGWYYGLDTNHAANQINLVTVLLHEFAHGLGFQSFASLGTGAFFLGKVDVYSKFYFDTTTGKASEAMTDAERVASAINPRRVVWTGSHVTVAAPAVLSPGTPLLIVKNPSSIAGHYDVGLASFGPPLSPAGVTGKVVLASDGTASPTLACSPLANGADVAGNVALVDRGTCTFVVKVKNAQNAGAVAVLVADNVAGGPPAGLGGADPTITIPSARITLADGNAIKAELGSGVIATLGLDLRVLAGASPAGQVLLYTPNPVQSGSSVSHWDTSTFPNQLMEPAINLDLKLAVDAPTDLTTPLFRDIGWYPDRDLDMVSDDVDQCLGSDLSPTVVIAGENTGVPNTLFANGCTIKDLVNRCAAGAANHGGFASCVAQLGNGLVAGGLIDGKQKGALQRAAAHAP